jgi:pyrroloquinoline quinone (PQQ) biosynthesis protein C
LEASSVTATTETLSGSAFREKLQEIVLAHHCANHPMTEKWAKGELGRDAMRGWATEQYHWVTNALPIFFDICARAPKDVIRAQLSNYREESDDSHSHPEIMLRFAVANGGNREAIMRGRGLPTTEAWWRYQRFAAVQPHWIAGVAFNAATESQSPMLYSKILPALRNVYKFKEDEIEHFWLHIEADGDDGHGGQAIDLLEKYCTTPELQALAIHWWTESTRTRWFHFDGIYLHYEMGYKLD